ncbi:MAG: hypothetical protein FJ027_12630 [Candidatus Rokubacteria bacterium]|nr:hypothetical protein [Candidatus Rokubacteria bacterium]
MPRVANPGLDVVLNVQPVDDVYGEDAMAVRVAVHDGRAPLRVSIYLDGDLVDTWVPGTTGYEMRLRDVRGRHVITARVIDATGRWGATSECVELAPALH